MHRPSTFVIEDPSIFVSALGPINSTDPTGLAIGGAAFSEIRDLIEVDMLAQSFFSNRPETETTILRPAHIVGFVRNAPSNYLRLPVIPTLMGFDPMAQIAHQDDGALDDVCWRLGHFASFSRPLRRFFPPEHFFVIVLEPSGHTR